MNYDNHWKKIQVYLIARIKAYAKPIVVGGGSDGASVNIGQHKSLKEKFQKALPWMFWSWCFAHRLELASRNGPTSPLFQPIEEMLLRLYHLY